MGNDAQIVHPQNLADFNALLSNSTFVVVDFSASWCPPCKAIHPFYNKLAATATVPGHLTFAYIDVDDVSDVALEYSVSAMPTFLFFAEGKIAAVDTNGAVKASTNPGAMMEQDRVKGIQGADARGLVSVVEALKRAADARAKSATAKTGDGAAMPKEAGEKSGAKSETPAAGTGEQKAAGDDKTVSGSYTMDAEGEAKETGVSA